MQFKIFHTALILSLLVTSSLTFLLDDATSDVTTKYGLVVDAGSSGTRLRVYSYKLTNNALGFANMSEDTNLKVSPGLSSFDQNISAIRGYLRPLMEKAINTVPTERQTDTPIFVLGTAGMRLESRDESNKVMDEVRRLLRDISWNPFHFRTSHVQVLSGEEEGVYAWVALNYVLGFFDSQSPKNQSTGAMEMGGGSTQIAFIPDNQPWAHEFQVIVGRRRYDLYVHSYLNFGMDGIQRRVAEYLARKGELKNPCLLIDDVKHYKLDNGTEVRDVGTGTPTQCQEILKSIVNPFPDRGILCQPKPCAVDDRYQPKLPNMPFYAVGSFDLAPRDLGVLGPNKEFDPVTLMMAGRDYCTKTVSDAIAMGQYKQWASDTCVMSLYTPTLMNAYGVNSATDIKATGEINNQDVEWAMGALIVDVSQTLSGIQSALRRRR